MLYNIRKDKLNFNLMLKSNLRDIKEEKDELFYNIYKITGENNPNNKEVFNLIKILKINGIDITIDKIKKNDKYNKYNYEEMKLKIDYLVKNVKIKEEKKELNEENIKNNFEIVF